MGGPELSRPPGRRRQAGVLGAAGLGSLCFVPVFGPAALAGPVTVVCLVGFVVVEVCRRRAAFAPWRPLLLGLGGLLTIVETTLFSTTIAGLPTPDTVRALGSGLWSWRQTLESTWPARAEPDLMLFVPLLVLVAAVLGVELLDRVGGWPAIVPSLAVVGLGQAYEALSGTAACLVALGYAVAVAAIVVPSNREAAKASRPSRRRAGRDPAPIVGMVVLLLGGMAGGLLFVDLDPLGRDPYTLQRAQAAQLTAQRTVSPLDEVASRLSEPGTEVFRYRTEAPVDRWRLVTLEDFDGTNWTTERPFLRLGTELPTDDAVRVPTTGRRAELDVATTTGPWLPSQSLPRAVDGARRVFVEPEGGTLLAVERSRRYALTWSTQQTTAQDLLTAAVDRRYPVGDLGRVPPEIAALGTEAVDGKRATFRTALALERYLATRYEPAGDDPPTGHGWPQLRRFLLEEKRGTSEQFAAAYVVLARLNGIPARLAVGYRAPVKSDPDGWTTVRNRDVLVWPEVAVDGIGWWPLDPAGLADPRRPAHEDRDGVTEQARAELPPPSELDDPALPSEPADRSRQDSRRPGPELPVDRVGWLLAVPPIGWLVGVPLFRTLRALHRRRRPGAAAVLGAWVEVRDRLRAHGVPVTAGMTVRDLAAAAGRIGDSPGDPGDRVSAGLDRLARAVDEALWSSEPMTGAVADRAWTAVHEVSRGLRRRPWSARMRAALDGRSLLPP